MKPIALFSSAGSFIAAPPKPLLYVLRVCLVLILVLSPPVQAGKVVLRVAAKAIPGFIEIGPKGFLIDILRSVEKVSDYRFDIRVLPPLRAIHEFSAGKADMLIPVPSPPSELSTAVFMKKSFIFCRRSDGEKKEYQDVSGLIVGLTQGYTHNLDALRAVGARIVQAWDDVGLVKMLAASRVDVIIGEEQSLLQAMRVSGIENLAYDQDHPLEVEGVYFQFRADAQLRETEKSINKLLASIVKP